MTVTLELKPELAAVARAEADAHGVSVQDYLQTHLETTIPAHHIPTEQEMAEFEADLDALAEGSERLPILPPEANKRAYYYEE